MNGGGLEGLMTETGAILDEKLLTEMMLEETGESLTELRC